jgi:hypothetical protein
VSGTLEVLQKWLLNKIHNRLRGEKEKTSFKMNTQKHMLLNLDLLYYLNVSSFSIEVLGILVLILPMIYFIFQLKYYIQSHYCS